MSMSKAEVRFALSFEPFRTAVQQAWAQLTEFATKAMRAFGSYAYMMNHRDKTTRAMKHAARRIELVEKRSKGFVPNITPQASAMHAAYRRRRR